MSSVTILKTSTLAFLLVSVLSGCTQERVLTHSATIPFDARLRTRTSEPQEFDDFQITQITTRTHFKTAHVMGRLKNVGQEPYQYVQITVEILDDADNVIDTVVANRAGLKPKQTWRFDIPVQREESVSKFRVASVTGW